jgi:hypothetical protein
MTDDHADQAGTGAALPREEWRHVPLVLSAIGLFGRVPTKPVAAFRHHCG